MLPDHYLFQELCTVAQRHETQNQKLHTPMPDKGKKKKYNSNNVIPPPAAWGFQRRPLRRLWACRYGRWCGSAPPFRHSWHTACNRRESWCSRAPRTGLFQEGGANAPPDPVLSSHETTWKQKNRRATKNSQKLETTLYRFRLDAPPVLAS